MISTDQTRTSFMQTMTVDSSGTARLARWSSAGVLLAALVPVALAAQEPANPAAAPAAAPAVPVRDVSPVVARTTQPLGGVNAVRVLSDGSLFVNDSQRRRLIKFDASLANPVIVADTAPGALMPYGQRSLGLMAYLGDTTIVVDASTMSLVALDPRGRTLRVMASPRPYDINTLASTPLASYAFDSQGRLYYRQGATGGGPGGGGGAMFGSGAEQRNRGGNQGGNPGAGGNRGAGGGFGGPPGGGGGMGGGAQGGQRGGGQGGRGFTPGNQPDSVPIIRVDFDTRKADTVTFVKVPKNDMQMTRGEDGSTRIVVKINPLPQADDWALLADGTVAVMRVLDYHVDYYRPDGSHVASDKLPFDWKHISDEEKTKMVDSLQTLAKTASERAGAGGGGGFRMNFEPIAADKLPDYFPPIRQGSSIADHQGNLWVLPSTSNLAAQLAQTMLGGRGMGPGMGGGGGPRQATPATSGAPAAATAGAASGAPAGAPGEAGRQGQGPAQGMMGMMPMADQPPLVYDVISREGKLMQRVKLPGGRQIVGFGPNGVLYLQVREGRDVYLETVKVP